MMAPINKLYGSIVCQVPYIYTWKDGRGVNIVDNIDKECHKGLGQQFVARVSHVLML